MDSAETSVSQQKRHRANDQRQHDGVQKGRPKREENRGRERREKRGRREKDGGGGGGKRRMEEREGEM